MELEGDGDAFDEDKVALMTKIEEMQYQLNKMQKELKKYTESWKDQKLFSKHIGEYLFHKFGFNIWLRLEMVKNAPDYRDSDADGEDELEGNTSSSSNSKQSKKKITIPIPKSIPRPVPQIAIDRSRSVSMGQRVLAPSPNLVGQAASIMEKLKSNSLQKKNKKSRVTTAASTSKPETATTNTIPVALTAVPETSSKTVVITAVPTQTGNQSQNSGQMSLVRTVQNVDPKLNPPPSITTLQLAGQGNKRKASEYSEIFPANNNNNIPNPIPVNPILTNLNSSPAKVSKSAVKVKPCSVVLESQPQLEKMLDVEPRNMPSLEPSCTTTDSRMKEPEPEPESELELNCQLITGDVKPSTSMAQPNICNLAGARFAISGSFRCEAVTGLEPGTVTGIETTPFLFQQQQQPVLHYQQVQHQQQQQQQGQHAQFNPDLLNDPMVSAEPVRIQNTGLELDADGTLQHRRKFLTTTTKDQTVVEIVEDYNDNDPNIDIKYEPQFIDEDDPEVRPPDQGEVQSNPGPGPGPVMSISVNNVSLLSEGAKPPPVGEVERRVIALQYRQSSVFDINWLFQMKKYQDNLMPFTMFVKRDEFRQWFEYLPSADPALSRYRCRLCYKYLQTYGIPRSYWGPIENELGQLKKTEADNRNAINAHARKKSHLEVMRKLQMEGNPDAGFVDVFDKNAKKKLIESIIRAGN